MAKKRIFTVGLDLPGDEFESIEFDSDQTLLDADIILFQPTLGVCSFDSSHTYEGRQTLSQRDSFQKPTRISHWHAEIVGAVNAGKLVVVFLKRPTTQFRHADALQRIGRTSLGGPVSSISSYDAVPSLVNVVPKAGRSIRLEKQGAFLKDYWSLVSSMSPYEVEIEVKAASSQVLMRSSAGDRVVGAAINSQEGGSILYLPPISYDEDSFVRDSEEDEDADSAYWTTEALEFGKQLVSRLVALYDGLKQTSARTVAPSWLDHTEYKLAQEQEIEAELLEAAAKIAVLQQHKVELEEQLSKAGALRHLLYEQGKPLEDAVLEAMRIFGFLAYPFVNQESEFDVVFESPEGRCLGEVEGRDSKAINVEKFSQLERNLQEDFAREEITEYAKGVLFGNAFRLMPVQQRGEFFTTKCLSAAKRIGAALVRTPDLFEPAKYLKENSDPSYAEACRKAILSSMGDVVLFPSPANKASALGATRQQTSVVENVR
ncbi:hypothetical protein GA0061098_1008125 [Bradyrhizobium shewense]|uniref:Uncharacterized protein n=1 Tax=Bradyrhizobium shewense TaxID=1761772 RepID=A0A1C3WJY1_9BRAD|nr:hypothetical protein [Bradyrhizobium shewense]SCB40367.1 hypothetical protein GA0061098_1008125 [Bradyrhizobium shewense]